MKPLKHFIIGLVAASLLYFLQITNLFFSLLVLATNSLVDSDHYFYYVYSKKDLSFRRAYNWFIKGSKTARKSILVFHSYEFLAFLILVSFTYSLAWATVLGVVVHFCCDIIDKTRRKMFFRNIVLTKF